MFLRHTAGSSRILLRLLGLLLLFLAGAIHAATGTLRVVTDNNYPPYVFPGHDGQPEGYVVDLWKLWESKTGVKVDFQAMQWSIAQRAMLNGEADVIDMIFRTPVREKIYDYSPPYAALPVGIYVESSIKGIHDARSMQGFTVGVQKGDACVEKLTSLGIYSLNAYPNYEAILSAAKSGDIKMFCMDEEPANYYLYLHHDRLRFTKAFTLYEGQFHWAVSRGDKTNFALVSDGMNLITPAEREALRQKWFKHPLHFRPYLRMFLLTLLGALVTLSIAMLWIWILRRLVNARTAEIRRQNELLEKASRELQFEKAQLRTLIESSPDAMALKDKNGIYIECNVGHQILLGFPRNQIIGHSDDELFADKNFVTLIRAHDQDAMHGDKPHKYETEVVAQNGSVRELEVIKVPVRADDGELAGVLAVARDISERRNAERELRIASVAFESHDGMVITDANGVIERVNAAFSRITGYSISDAIGKTPRLLKSGQHDNNFYQDMWAMLQTHGHWSGEITNRRRDGSLFIARLSITAVHDTQGKTVHFIGNIQDISSEIQARELATHLKLFDHLTDLPNRSLLEERMSRGLEQSAKSQEFGALIMLDLDLFHKVNDSLGHAIGDQLLIEVAQRILSVVHDRDTLCRFSGDSFVVLLEGLGTDRNAAASRASSISESIRLSVADPVHLGEHRVICSGSLGVTLYQGHKVSTDTLLRQAELAMYKSKKSGRNVVRFFEDEMQSELDQRNLLESELRDAIANNQFELYYQVQVDTQQMPIGAEALIRWIHPTKGIVPPAIFIPFAEEIGLIADIDRWTFASACRQAALWMSHDILCHLTIAVNISPSQFKSANFVEDVLDELKRSGASASKLKIEVTESLAIDDFDHSISKLQALAESGFRISLDDFGTGNSSLNYLTKLPLAQLKIDKSFVDNIPSSYPDAMVAQTIIGMGQGLELNVIAEGVETQAQHEFLVAHGCHAFQGYFFGKPVPVREFESAVEAIFMGSTR